MTNRIDILLATYNGEKYIGTQLDSLFAQTCQDFQLLVRDDGSQDKTLNIIEEYSVRYPGRIQLISDKLGGLRSSGNFMTLLSHSTADYIMFCDQDDFWLSEKIELSLSKIKEMEAEFGSTAPLLAFTDLKVTDGELNVTAESFWKQMKLNPNISKNWKELLAQNVITGCTIIINSALKEISLPFRLPYMIHDQWISVNAAKYGHIDHISTPMLLYRQHGDNVEGAHTFGLRYLSKKIMDIKKIISNYGKAVDCFNNISITELIYIKIKINLIRLI